HVLDERLAEAVALVHMAVVGDVAGGCGVHFGEPWYGRPRAASPETGDLPGVGCSHPSARVPATLSATASDPRLGRTPKPTKGPTHVHLPLDRPRRALPARAHRARRS